jgi:uncharacterized phage protein gp47/JayE
MADIPTRTDFMSVARAYLAGLPNLRVAIEELDVAGSDVNVVIGSGAAMAAHFAGAMAYRVSAQLLDAADGDDLYRWGVDRYESPVKGAAPSVVTVKFYRPTAGAGAGNIATNTRVSSEDGVEYATTSTAVFGASALYATATAQSVQTGSTTRVGTGKLTKIVDRTLLFDTTVQVTNEERSAGGDDRETEEAYRDRLRKFWSGAQRGTLSALEFAALAVPGVSSAIAEDILEDGVPARVARITVADGTGTSNAPLKALVEVAIEAVRPAGIYVEVVSSATQSVNLRLRFNFRAGVNTTDLREDVVAAIVEYVNTLGVNQPLTRTGLGAVMERFRLDGLLPDSNSIVEPVGDVYPSAGYTLRTSRSLIEVV